MKAIYYPGAPHGITATHQSQVTVTCWRFLREHTRVQAWSIYWCHAAGRSAVRVAALAAERNGSPVVAVSDHARLAGLFRQIIDELAHGYGPPQLLTASLTLGHLLGCVYTESVHRAATVPDVARRVHSIAAYLRQHPERPARLEELARMANLSMSHFSAVFRRELGFSPLDYLARARIGRACQLLDTTGAPLKQIAEAVGFSDPLYFSRVCAPSTACRPVTTAR